MGWLSEAIQLFFYIPTQVSYTYFTRIYTVIFVDLLIGRLSVNTVWTSSSSTTRKCDHCRGFHIMYAYITTAMATTCNQPIRYISIHFIVSYIRIRVHCACVCILYKILKLTLYGKKLYKKNLQHIRVESVTVFIFFPI